MSSWFTNNRDPAKTMETTVLIAPSYWQRDPRWWLSSLSIEGSPRKCQPIRRLGQRQLKHNNNFLLSATGILTSIGDCACVVIPYGVVVSVSGSSVRASLQLPLLTVEEGVFHSTWRSNHNLQQISINCRVLFHSTLWLKCRWTSLLWWWWLPKERLGHFFLAPSEQRYPTLGVIINWRQQVIMWDCLVWTRVTAGGNANNWLWTKVDPL